MVVVCGWLVAFLGLLSVIQSGQVYTNYQVIRVVPQTKRQVLELQSLSRLHTKCEEVDFWTSAKIIKKPVDIMVSPTAKEYIKLALDIIGAPHHVIIDNVQEVIDRQKNYRTKSDNDDDFFKEYHTFDEITEFTNGLLDTYSNILSEQEIGTSYEGRPMRVIKISTGGTCANKKVIWWQGGIHAREWISPATLMYITKQLLEDFTKDCKTISNILRAYDIYVLFVTNPDGYQYTWDEKRLWRKTRSPNEGSDCIGTDPNRNFPYMWGGDGASPYPCSETYRGSGPASEQEIKAVVDFLGKIDNSAFQMFIDFHSYSQLILYPYGYSTEAERLENEKEVNELAGKIASAIKSVSGTSYEYGNSADVLYAAAGASDDYAASVGARFPYTIELPDKGRYGFLLPEEDIIPTGEETYSGILAALNYLLTNAVVDC